ncbi:MAG: hypothetical protein QW743_02445 [Candidatus Methanomethylicia archaeon]
MSRGKVSVKERCHICGRKLSRNSLTISRGNLKPMYEYILKNGEKKFLCSTCFNKIVGLELLEFLEKINEESSSKKVKVYSATNY